MRSDIGQGYRVWLGMQKKKKLIASRLLRAAALQPMLSGQWRVTSDEATRQGSQDVCRRGTRHMPPDCSGLPLCH